LRPLEQALVAFVKENVRIFTPPCCATFPIFTDDDPELNTSATVASLASPAQLEHAVTQFVADYDRRRRCWSNRDRSSRRGAIFWRDHDPRSIATLPIATILIVTIAARSRLALRGNNGAGGTTDDCADCGPTATAQCSAYDRSGSAAQERAAQRILCGRILNGCGNGDSE
jgi:hypothetical protein